MGYLNKALLMGNLTRDPEIRYTTNGTPICTFDIAINRFFKETKEVTYLKIETWGKQADFCKQYLKQGRSVFVEGRIKVEQWDAKDGTKRKQFVIVAEQISFADSKGAPQGGGESVTDEAPSDDMPQQGGAEKKTNGSVDDDLPF